MGLNTTQVVIVSTGAYPRLVPKGRAKQAMTQLRSDEMLAKASRIIALKTAELRGAVLELVEQTEEAAKGGDWTLVYEATHEIRGLAGTAGLGATGRIANGLCHYLDTIAELSLVPDAAVANLHLDAIGRSARIEDDAARHGDAVAQELAALVARKLAEIKDSATGPARSFSAS